MKFRGGADSKREVGAVRPAVISILPWSYASARWESMADRRSMGRTTPTVQKTLIYTAGVAA